MPPKIKKPKASTKTPTSSQHSINSSSLETSDTPGMQQFERELCWCIQQLQSALKLGKLNNKQVQDHTKALTTLMSNNAPLVKKRQIMRLSFGDYREKMAVEDKTSRNVVNIKVRPSTPSKKSIFIKKSIFSHSSGSTFIFDFQNKGEDNVSNLLGNVTIKHDDDSKCITNSFNFVPSENSFRFGFNINE